MLPLSLLEHEAKTDIGGRIAEEIFVHDISSGAQMDITQATRLVRSMVCEWGMTDKLGAVAYDERQEGGQYLGVSSYRDKSYSEETARSIDLEVRKLLDEAHERAREIILEKKEQVQLMTEMLMEFESLDRDDVLEIMNGTWDIAKKRDRLKISQNLNRKTPPPPPEKVADRDLPPPVTDTPAPQQG